MCRDDAGPGAITEVKLPINKNFMDIQNPADRAFYENFNELGFNSPVPWSQGPRRMGTDKNADVLWVGNSWGASLAKINTKTLETTMVPFPDKTMQPYHIAVDNNHNVWGNLWTSDQIVKFDPTANKWTTFELPVRGTEIRHISLNDIGGKSYVVVPVYRSSQMAKMTVRSEAELAALKAQAQ
jgi:streptogramin lyase